MKKQFKLPKEFAEKWLTALRSGEYKQGRGALCKTDRNDHSKNYYCCLGVACAILDISKDRLIGHSAIYDNVFFPEVPVELLGLYANIELPYYLSKLNDERKYSFTEIADWIDKNVEKY